MKRCVLFLSVLVAQTALAQYPPVVTRSRLDPERGVNFHAVLLPDTVYVGQQSTYQIGVFLNQDVRQRLRRNPEFVPPETRSLLVYDLPDAKGPLVGTIDGRQYEVHVFQRAFFALSPGNYDIPPSKLTYALPQSASFFSREESHTLRSELRTLVVLPVPTAGRPDDWGGAVGEWRARLRVDSASGRVGNPLVVTLRIEGQGNVTLLPRPKLTVEWGSLVAADERVDFDSTPSTLRGAKEFDWLLTPRTTGRQMIPQQRFSYFDPVARRFELATTAAISVTIAAGDPVAADSTPLPMTSPPETASAPPPLSMRPLLGDASGRSPLRSTWLLVLLAIAPLPALTGAIVRRPRRMRRAPNDAQRLREAAHGTSSPSRDAAAVRRMLHGALRDRLGFDAGLALANGSVVAALRHEGVTVDTARRAETLLRLLDAAVFSAATNAGAPDASALVALYASIDTEARHAGAVRAGRAARGVARALMVVACCGALPLLAWQGDAADKSWAAAHVAFASGDYTRAERHFLDAARVHPDFANAWANAGTAAWMAADTARAVQGWQRALRLQPMDREMRDRLALVRAVQDRGPARVPAVPVRGPAFILLVVWLAGWATLARRAWRRGPFALRAAWLIVTCAPVVVAATWLDEVQRADAYVVVTRPEPLRTLPVLGAESGPVPLTGEVGHVLQRQGAWALVQLDGQRQGWMAAELLLPLGSD